MSIRWHWALVLPLCMAGLVLSLVPGILPGHSADDTAWYLGLPLVLLAIGILDQGSVGML